MISVSYCSLEEQTLTLLLRSVRANCALQVLRLEGNNLTGKGTFILSESLGHWLFLLSINSLLCCSGCYEIQREPAGALVG